MAQNLVISEAEIRYDRRCERFAAANPITLKARHTRHVSKPHLFPYAAVPSLGLSCTAHVLQATPPPVPAGDDEELDVLDTLASELVSMHPPPDSSGPQHSGLAELAVCG